MRERASALHSQEAAARDAGLRAAAARRARDAAERANQELGAARSEVEAADREVADNTPTDRPRHTQKLRAEPADRDDALRFAAATAEEAATLQIEVTRLERERDKAAEEARDWTARAGMLRDQADKLPGVEPAAAAAGTIDADDDQVRRAAEVLARQMEAAESAYASAVSARSQRADAPSRFPRSKPTSTMSLSASLTCPVPPLSPNCPPESAYGKVNHSSQWPPAHARHPNRCWCG